MPSDRMISRKDDGVGWMIFNNPERHNAISLEMWEAALEIMADFSADPSVRVMVVTGAGGKAFASGADISKFKDERQEAEAVAHYQATTQKAYSALQALAIPTIAMIRGYCIGGGTAAAVCCDLRICTENAKFGVPAAKLGLGYGLNRAQPLVDLVGPAYAKEMFFTVTGKLLVTELGIELPPGRLVGELGFLSPDNRRTGTVECIEDVEVLTMTYDRLLEIYFQNPEFGYYFLRLSSERLMQNNARLEKIIEQYKASLKDAGAKDTN